MQKITIFENNHKGMTAEITLLLNSLAINIECINAFTLKGYGLISITVDRYDDALKALQENGWHAVTDPTLLLILKDKPGSLAAIAGRLKEEDINLNSIRTALASCFSSATTSSRRPSRSRSPGRSRP